MEPSAIAIAAAEIGKKILAEGIRKWAARTGTPVSTAFGYTRKSTPRHWNAQDLIDAAKTITPTGKTKPKTTAKKPNGRKR